MISGGFFTKEQTNILRGDEAVKAPSKPRNAEKLFSCQTCGRDRAAKCPVMPGKGNGDILVVGEAPSDRSDKTGSLFADDFGEAIKKAATAAGLVYGEDTRSVYAVRCYGKAAPTGDQIAACRSKLVEEVKKRRPKVLVLLGKQAVDSVFGPVMFGRLGGTSIADWVGYEIPWGDFGTWVLPVWGRWEILTQKGQGEWTVDPVALAQLTSTFKRAKELKEIPLPIYNWREAISVVASESEAIAIVRRATIEQGAVAFDYETTGIKPQAAGHAIITCGIFLPADNKAYGFPYFNSPEFKDAWTKFLISGTRKICHNKKFEQVWSFIRGGENWPDRIIWDTMLAARVLRNQGKKGTSLKFQVLVNFGVAGYDAKVDHYLEAPKKAQDIYGANAVNRTQEAPIQDLCFYNAADAYWTFQLYQRQLERLPKHCAPGVRFFTAASECLARAETAGISIDMERLRDLEARLSQRMDQIEAGVKRLPELSKWNKKGPFRIGAADDLTHLLFNVLGLTPQKHTASGKPAADQDALEAIDCPVIPRVMAWRKLQKAKDTYVAQYAREAVNGLLHPSFHLHVVDTFRSSSSDPNFQNIPKRDKEIAAMLRGLLRPRKGRRLTEYDYKAIEVCIIASYNKDPNLIRYVTDSSTDMHRDMAAKLFCRRRAAVRKEERQGAKNGFVFPTFYGSYWKNTAENLWLGADEITMAHLKDQGFRTLDDYRVHVKEVENHFWRESFPVAHEWMERALRDYESKGYVDLYTGFRCYGPMSRNQVINYRIQGSAFHCLLWTMMEVEKALRKAGAQSLQVGQIHDAIVNDVVPDEMALLDQLMYEIGTQRIREHWEWIMVPLSIEKSQSAVDGSWAEMEDCGLLSKN